MPDVVLVCAEADQRMARLVVKALRREGWEIFLAIDGAGEQSAERLTAALNQAAAVVVLWSKTAMRDATLVARARVADHRNAIVSASVDGSVPPADFDDRTAVDLSDWKGETSQPDISRLIDAVRTRVEQAPSATRESFLHSFFFFGGLHFGQTLDDAIARFGLPSESSATMVAYEHTHADGPGLVLVQTHDENKLINYVVVHGAGGVAFLADHDVVDPRLSFIGMHKDDIFRILGAPSQNIGELEDGRICFGYNTIIGVEASSPDGETARFGLVIYVLFYISSRDIPFCMAMSVQWDPVPLPEATG